jgi:hypothetical protein
MLYLKFIKVKFYFKSQALKHKSVLRLKKSWNGINKNSTQNFKTISKHCDEYYNIHYLNYLKKRIYFSSYIPNFLESHITDLLTLNNDTNKLINFEKKRKISLIINNFILFQNIPYAFSTNFI